MGGPASQQLTNGTVAPNQTVDISVELTAPNDPGTYKGNWKLENAQGQEFALRDSNSPFFVEIVVADPVSFTLAFDNVHDCTGGYATVKITNTGTVFLQSAQMQVEDIDDNVSLYGPLSSNNPFVTTPNGCPPGNSDADPGETYYIAVYIGAAPVSGNTAEFTLTLCTDDDLGGTCVTQKVQFEIP